MTKKKNILILPRWYPNKTDIQLGTFIQRQAVLMRDDYNLMVIYVQGVEGQQEKFEFEQSTSNGFVERIIYYRQSVSPLRKIVNARRYKLAQRLGLKDSHFTPDLCHVHVPYRSAFLALEFKRKGTPFVITEHWSGHINGEFAKKNATDLALYKQVLSKSAGISTVSALLQEKFKENTGFENVLIPNLIEFTAVPESAHESSDYIEILSVGDIADEVKNFSGLIMAFKKALKNNSNLRLTIIGGGPDEALISKMISDLNLDNFIDCKGRLDHAEVLKAFHHCDFYVCNSNFETFGMTSAEALICGKPVISTKCGGPEEFINDKNGLLIAPRNADQLANAIEQMAVDYTSYQDESIKADIKKRFGAETIKAKWIEFYENI
ncbi:MAG: glycosyltransferase [Crocinitomicaceae bacterium]